MTKIDKSYLEKLGEVLYDEKKAVNYKTVSMMLGVHVNIAKQMLYHMYKTAETEGRKVYATYYISGMLPRKVLLSLGRKGGETAEETSSQQSTMDDLDVYLVSICRERDLEDLKSKYSKIFSIHVYSLSSFPVENYDVLEGLVEFPMRDSEGRTPVDFGPVMCSESHKLLQNVKKVVNDPNKDVSKPKSDENIKPKGSNEEGANKVTKSSVVDENLKVIASQGAKSQTQKSVKPVVAEKKDTGRLKSMFTAAASKPKQQPVKKVEPTVKSQIAESKEEVKESSTNRSKDKETRKRKRIRDVLSSDSEDEKKSEAEDSPPESPVARKRIQIESDSDDDAKETTKVKEDSPLEKKEKHNVAPGRKRVAKMVSKSHVDKDGFLVTTREQVMVSEDDDETDEKARTANMVPKEKSSNESSSQASLKSQNSSNSNAAKSVVGKTKQASLMSFFQKK